MLHSNFFTFYIWGVDYAYHQRTREHGSAVANYMQMTNGCTRQHEGGVLIEKPADSAASFHLIGRLGDWRNWGDFLRWTLVMYKLMKIANLFAETGANYFKVWLMVSVEHLRVQTLTFGRRADALYNSSGRINIKTFSALLHRWIYFLVKIFSVLKIHQACLW